VCRGATTNSSRTELFLDGVSERILVPTSSTWGFDVLITGRASSGNSAAYNIRGAIKNNLGSITVVGSVKTVLAEDDAAWDATVVADQPNQSLVVRVTGPLSGAARWVASV